MYLHFCLFPDTDDDGVDDVDVSVEPDEGDDVVVGVVVADEDGDLFIEFRGDDDIFLLTKKISKYF